MALGAVVGAALATGTARPFALWLNEVDVVKEPGSARYGVSIDSVSVKLQGPGGVSSMTFTLDDPQSVLAPTDGMAVRFRSLTFDTPLFTGYVESFDGTPDFGQQGRSWQITATGVETLLDWLVLGSDYTWSSGASFAPAIQALLASCVGHHELRAFTGTDDWGLPDQPIARFQSVTNSGPDLLIRAGTTLRNGINLLLTNSNIASLYLGAFVTVDHHMGLRAWPIVAALTMPNGDGSAAIGTGSAFANDLTYTVDTTALIRNVVIANASGTWTGSDGSGKPGRSVVISDATITTAAQAAATISTTLARNTTGIRGTFGLFDWGGFFGADDLMRKLLLTDGNVGATGTYLMAQLALTFPGGTTERVGVTFGGLPASAALLLRRLTRSTLS